MDSIISGIPRCKYASSITRKTNEPLRYPLHHHPGHAELLLITEGKVRYAIDNQPFTAVKGDMVVFAPGAWHEERSDSSAPLQYYYAGFEGLHIQGLPDGYLLAPESVPVFRTQTRFPRLRSWFEYLTEIVESKRPEYGRQADFLLGLIVAEVCQLEHYPHSAALGSSADQLVMQAQLYMTEQYHHPLMLKDIADAVHISPCHLSHLFTQVCGQSPLQYLIEQRIHAAKQYLATTSYTVERIAELVGYASATAFHQAFRKRTGLSPGQFRKKSRRLPDGKLYF